VRVDRDNLLKLASDHNNRSMQLDYRHPINWVFRAVMHVASNCYSDADSCIKNALQADPNCIPALLGKAFLLTHDGAYKKALLLYQKVLRLNPDAPSDARVGIGLCFYHLKNFNLARAAFERVLQIDPHHEDALIAMAVLMMNTPSLDNHLARAIDYIHRAYKVNPSNPIVLNHLADNLFFKGDFAGSLRVAEWAKDVAGVPDTVQAETFYQIARCYHVQAEYDRAFNNYKFAHERNPEHTLAMFGYAQLLMRQNAFDEASRLLERVSEKYRDNFEVLRLLGSVYLKTGKEKNARQVLAKATKLYPNEIETWLEYAYACLPVSTDQSYDAFRTVVRLAAQSGTELPWIFWNNLGVTCHMMNKFVDSLKAYMQALGPELSAQLRLTDYVEYIVQRSTAKKHNLLAARKADRLRRARADGDMTTDNSNNNDADAEMTAPVAAPIKHIEIGAGDDFDLPLSKITVAYNLGLVFEIRALYENAANIYNAILKQYPEYHDCVLRLGHIARTKGDFKTAAKYFKQVLDANPKDFVSRTLLANLDMHANHFDAAKKMFSAIFKDSGQTDRYAQLALANIALKDKSKLARERSGAIRYAVRIYQEVLTADPKNLYAANGLGVILLREAELASAKETFAQIREATGDVPDVWINLAHIYVAQRQYDHAIKMYHHIIEKFNRGTDVYVVMCLANAQYIGGNAKAAQATLQRALRLAPNDSTIWYNLAVSLEDHAISLLKSTHRSYQEVRGARSDLKQAAAIFDRISKLPQAPEAPGYLPRSTYSMAAVVVKKTVTHRDFCLQSFEKTKNYLEQAAVRETQRKQLLQKTAQVQQEARLKQELEAQRQREEAEAARKEYEERALEQKLKQEVLQDDMQKRALFSKSRKKDKDFVVSDAGDGDGDGDGLPDEEQKELDEIMDELDRPKPQVSSRRAKAPEFQGLPDDFEDPEDATAAGDDGDDNDDDDDGDKSGKKKTKTAKKKKKKRVLSKTRSTRRRQADDSDDDDDGEAGYMAQAAERKKQAIAAIAARRQQADKSKAGDDGDGDNDVVTTDAADTVAEEASASPKKKRGLKRGGRAVRSNDEDNDDGVGDEQEQNDGSDEQKDADSATASTDASSTAAAAASADADDSAVPRQKKRRRVMDSDDDDDDDDES
jgi:RNA polymerase-associated protein CTR9